MNSKQIENISPDYGEKAWETNYVGVEEIPAAKATFISSSDMVMGIDR